MFVAIARVANGRCSFLQSNGSFGRPRACSAPHDLRVRGTTRWSLGRAVHFPAGTYRLWFHAVDVAGNVERRRVARLVVAAAAPRDAGPRFSG